MREIRRACRLRRSKSTPGVMGERLGAPVVGHVLNLAVVARHGRARLVLPGAQQ
jgi:hypothetical protein